MVKILATGFFSDKSAPSPPPKIDAEDLNRVIAELKQADLNREEAQLEELDLIAKNFPQVKELEEKAPDGLEVIPYLKNARDHPSLGNDDAYEKLIAYTFLSRGDGSTTEALLQCLSHEKSIEYLAAYRDLLKSGNRLLVQLQLKKYLTEQGSELDQAVQSKFTRLKDDYIRPGEIISPTRPM